MAMANRAPVPTALSSPVTMFAAADIDGDGRQDLLVYTGVTTQTSSPWTILLGNGTGSFRTAGTIGSTQPFSVNGSVPFVLGDFDGNGRPDIADSLNVWLNRGNGVFSNPIGHAQTSLDMYLGYVVAGDFNNDGILDLWRKHRIPATSELLLETEMALSDRPWSSQLLSR
jgi:hypothetical protein